MAGASSKTHRYHAVGERLALLRVALGYERNQKGFALFVGIASNTWNNYEKGLRQPNLEQVAKIRQKTGVTRDWIYDGSVSGLPVDLLQKLGAVSPKSKSA